MMEENQSRLSDHVRNANPEFKKLEKEHHRLEIKLNALVRHKTMTPQEQTQKKRIQKEKLHTKDRMEVILRLGKPV